MIFNIPQFIDVEDKIVGPLTAKQLGWLALGFVCLLLFWNTLDFSAFLISGIFVLIIFGALAFYRPNGQPLTYSISAMVIFLSKPKMYMWRRTVDTKGVLKHKKIINANAGLKNHKEVTLEEIEKVSHLLEIKKK